MRRLASALVLTAFAGCFMAIDGVRSLDDGQGGAALSEGAGGSTATGQGGAGVGGEQGSAIGGGGGGGAGGGGAEGGGSESMSPCEILDFKGACVGQTSIFWWDEDDVDPSLDGKPAGCWVRDCAAEGVVCTELANSQGFGCAQGSFTQQHCMSFGYTGICGESGTAVWWEDGICHWEHCPNVGKACGMDSSLGRHACQ